MGDIAIIRGIPSVVATEGPDLPDLLSKIYKIRVRSCTDLCPYQKLNNFCKDCSKDFLNKVFIKC